MARSQNTRSTGLPSSSRLMLLLATIRCSSMLNTDTAPSLAKHWLWLRAATSSSGDCLLYTWRLLLAMLRPLSISVTSQIRSVPSVLVLATRVVSGMEVSLETPPLCFHSWPATLRQYCSPAPSALRCC